MRRLSCLLLSFAVFGVLQLPAFGQDKEKPKDLPKIVVVPKAPPGPCFKHLDGQMLVFAVNGVGGSTTLSDHLVELNSERQLGLRIQNVAWSRTLSIFQDLRDSEAQLGAAAKIACSVTAIRKDAPKAHIFLIGHSAGARVVLAAAEMLPPKSIDRIIVLSPAVASSYDLTGALKATRYGIDNFYSSEDGLLDAENQHYRNADGAPGHAAGKHGFRMVSCEKKDIDAYRALRQYRWKEDYFGNGGHSVWTLRHNLNKVVLPVLFTAPVIPPPAAVDTKEPPLKK